MHCKICNAELSDFEATRRDANTYQFVDTCNECLAYIGTTTVDRFDLADENDLDGLDAHLSVD
jgi:hypothetical protein